MKAFAYDRYGPPAVVHPVTLPRPDPGPGEIVIRVVATTVSAGDWRARSMIVPPGMGWMARLFFGITRPRKRILGTEAAGVVDSVGTGVRTFAPGDRVIAYPASAFGAHAEYVAIPADGRVVPMPEGMGWEEAAALPFGGVTALDFLVNKARIQPGERVLINGASGAVGTAAVQIAVHLGARVTAVCSARNAALVRELGAVEVIDYTTTDFATRGPFDVTIDCVGTAPWRHARRALRRGGRHVAITSGLGDMVFGPLKARLAGRRMVVGVSSEAPEVLRQTVALARAGHLRPVIDRVFGFDQMVAAHSHVDGGHKTGNVVVAVSHA